MTRARVLATLALAGLSLTACGGAGPQDVSALDSSPTASDGSAREDVPSALRQAIDDPSLPDPLVDPSEMISGGPPPDGIPPVDDPVFVDPAGVDWLVDDEPVVALELDGEHRAYPVQIMIWHEIVNDTVAGTPLALTYCPLCNSALAFDRRSGDRLLTFGTSGQLYRSDLVMYDRQTESLWSQLEGRAVAGHLTGTELERLPVQVVTWEQWRDAHPDGLVLSRDTGAQRTYGSNPYVGYDEAGSDPFLFAGEADPRLAPKERVVGVGDTGGDPVAVPLAALAQARVVEQDVAGEPVVLWAAGGLRSALDTREIAEGRVVAASGAFDPRVDGERLTFAAAGDDTFTDAGTGSTWDVEGVAVAGPLTGSRLRPVGHVDTFWFAWAAFHPETRLVTPGR